MTTIPEPLLVVDVQQGFLNQFTSHIPERIVRLIERTDHAPVLFTRFVNPPNGPYHRFLDWHACEGPPETDFAPALERFARPDLTFTKPGYTGISDELATYLRDCGAERVTIVGIDTDMCVLKIAMDVFDLGLEPIVLIDCCASTAGLQAHLAGSPSSPATSAPTSSATPASAKARSPPPVKWPNDDRRQAAGGRRQAAGGRRQAAGTIVGA